MASPLLAKSNYTYGSLFAQFGTGATLVTAGIETWVILSQKVRRWSKVGALSSPAYRVSRGTAWAGLNPNLKFQISRFSLWRK